MIPGGLTDLVAVAGHVENEIRVGTRARAKAALPPGRAGRFAGDRDRPRTWWAYFRASGRPERGQLDQAVRVAVAAAGPEASFWDSFGRRVNESLGEELRVPVTVYLPVGATEPLPALRGCVADVAIPRQSHPGVTSPGHASDPQAAIRDRATADWAYDQEANPTALAGWDVFGRRLDGRARSPLRGVATGLPSLDRTLLGLDGLVVPVAARVLVVVDDLGHLDIPEGVPATSLEADVHRIDALQWVRVRSRSARWWSR